MSAFDHDKFLQSTYENGVDTRYAVHRPGSDWMGSIGTGEKDVAFRTIQFTDKQTGQKEERLMLDVWIQADDPAAQAEGFDPPARVRYSCFIDVAPSGGLDFSPGKNRQLGNLLTALGFQDKTGKLTKAWSPPMFKGMRLRYAVEHAPLKDGSDVVANVKSVAAL